MSHFIQMRKLRPKERNVSKPTETEKEGGSPTLQNLAQFLSGICKDLPTPDIAAKVTGVADVGAEALTPSCPQLSLTCPGARVLGKMPSEGAHPEGCRGHTGEEPSPVSCRAWPFYGSTTRRPRPFPPR